VKRSLLFLLALQSVACIGLRGVVADTDEPNPEVDADGDGFIGADDCDDNNADAYPLAPEFCDGTDGNCNGQIDDNPVDAGTWFADSDGDGFGLVSYSFTGCDAPADYTSTAGDCDDTNAAVNPGATESCNGIDDDCDSLVDANDPDAVAGNWYPDADLDGYGDEFGTPTLSCDQPSGAVSGNTDCDDGAASVHPGATEICDGLDGDCDGVIPADEIDGDLDGASTCEGDPDDTDPTIFVDAVAYEIGGTSSNWTASNYFRANTYQAYDNRTLVEFEHYLSPSGSCDVGFFVFSSSTQSGPWTLQWSSMVTHSAGESFKNSGPINLALTSGTYYALGAGWDCSSTYYGLSVGGLAGTDAGVGYFQTNTYDNSYPLFSASFNPTGTGSAALAYKQRVTVIP